MTNTCTCDNKQQIQKICINCQKYGNHEVNTVTRVDDGSNNNCKKHQFMFGNDQPAIDARIPSLREPYTKKCHHDVVKKITSKKRKSSCTCDTMQTYTETCFHCHKEWEKPKSYYHRVMECAVHRHTISIRDTLLCLCEPCISQGYYIMADYTGPLPPFSGGPYVVKKYPCICDDETQTSSWQCWSCSASWEEKKNPEQRAKDCKTHSRNVNTSPVNFRYCVICAQKYPCTCYDEAQTSLWQCLSCHASWEEKKNPEQRVKDCMMHNRNVNTLSLNFRYCAMCTQ